MGLRMSEIPLQKYVPVKIKNKMLLIRIRFPKCVPTQFTKMWKGLYCYINQRNSLLKAIK